MSANPLHYETLKARFPNAVVLQEPWFGDAATLYFDKAFTVTFDDLVWLSELFGTTKIDFSYERGFGGSPETSADAAEFYIRVGDETTGDSRDSRAPDEG